MGASDWHGQYMTAALQVHTLFAHRAHSFLISLNCVGDEPILLPDLSDLYSNAALLLTLAVCTLLLFFWLQCLPVSLESSSLNLASWLCFLSSQAAPSMALPDSLVGFQLTLFSCCPHSAIAQFWIRPVISRSQCHQNWWHLMPLLSWAPVLLDFHLC